MHKAGIEQSVQARLRRLPAVDDLLRVDAVVQAARGLPAPLATDTVREVLSEARARVLAGEADLTTGEDAADGHRYADDCGLLTSAVVRRLEGRRRAMLTRVVNAAGVVLHTNLGRAPLSDNALQAVRDVAGGYSNLEYDVPDGRRGSRDIHGETLLTRLTGAEAALIVNNNAAAVLLVLSALAGGREVILSRGEMIEIGGAFRIPEVMEQSGCTLREVGTTNRTHLRDYSAALGDETAAILKVHPSNYRVVGFTSGVDARALAGLARQHDVPLIEDLGSGVLVDTQQYGLAPEPTVQNSIAAGVDVVTFSGDKLLGGPQAGIIVGRRDLIELCRRHPLARALRVDKMTLAALQATLIDYLHGDADRIPIYTMMATSVESLRRRAKTVCSAVTERDCTAGERSPVQLRVVDTVSTVGGGSLPGETLPSAAIEVRCAGVGADEVAAALRRHRPPVISRIEADACLLDLRTVAPEDDELLVAALIGLTNSIHSPDLGTPETQRCTS